MTLGAMAAWQGWALLGGVSAVAVCLCGLKVRPCRVRVRSWLFWGRVLSDARQLTLWERIRRAVSLAVTAAIAIALALALLRPALSKGEGASRALGAAGAIAGRSGIVIDSSWSMLARTRGGTTRWGRAIAEARRLTAASPRDVALPTTADGPVEGPTAARPL